MEFIVDNIIWFIVGGVIILMTIVGYLAEKTDFASKRIEKEHANKEDKKAKENTPVSETVKPVEETVQNMGIGDLMNAPKVEENSTSVSEDLYAPIGDVTPTQATDIASVDVQLVENNSLMEQNLENEIPSDLFAPLSDSSNDNTVENENSEELFDPFAVGTEVNNEVTVENVETEANVIENNLEQSSAVEPIASLNIEEASGELTETNISNEEINSLNLANDESLEGNGFTSLLEEPTANMETSEAPVQEENLFQDVASAEAETTSTDEIDNSEFSKIFPDDPVIIKGNHAENAETQSTQEVVEQPEDIWKF